MKSFLFLVLMLLAGAVAGYAWTRVELGPFGRTPNNIGLDLPTADRHRLPKLEVLGGSTFDFGTMIFDTKRQHSFQIKNLGDAPLTLKLTGTSCRCTLAALPNNELAPGEVMEVDLEWKANERHGPFSQTATLETNDPRMPRLILGVEGKVVGTYLVESPEVILTKVPFDKPTSGEFLFYTYTSDKVPAPADVVWNNPETAAFYEVKFQPLTEEDLKRDDQPTGGYRGIVTVLPGQPTGDFRQALEFHVDVPDRPLVKIEIRGSIAGRGSISGTTNWEPEFRVYELGDVPRGEVGRTEGLMLILRGDQREKLKPTATELSPKFLQVEFGVPTYLADRDQTHVPFTIVVPADAPAEVHMGQGRGTVGRIAIDPGLPDQPRLRLSLRFSTL